MVLPSSPIQPRVRAMAVRVMRCECPAGMIDFHSRSLYPLVTSARACGLMRRDAGAVERGGLENRCARKRTEGSNPSLSAIYPHHLSQKIPAPCKRRHCRGYCGSMLFMLVGFRSCQRILWWFVMPGLWRPCWQMSLGFRMP